MRPPRIAALAAGAILLTAVPASAHHKPGHRIPPGHANRTRPAVSAPCKGNPSTVGRIDLTVSGQPAWGLFALPSRTPKGLVVFAHGYGHTVESWRSHLSEVARRLDVVTVAMNYRGQVDSPPASPGALPTSRGWQVAEGAEDSIAAAKYFDGLCPKLGTIVMYGVSMGGNTSGLAVAAKATRRNGKPLFDWWFDIEGAANVTETYAEARGLASSGNTFAKNAQADIEREMGGTFEDKRDVYLSRTVVNRIDDIKASGVRGVVVVHAVDDGLVPYNQSRELVGRLRAVGVPADFFTVVTRGDKSEPGTTADGYVTGNVPGFVSPFAGHASEASKTHIVGTTGFGRLAALFDGTKPGCREWVVDGTLDPVSPHPVTTGPTC